MCRKQKKSTKAMFNYFKTFSLAFFYRTSQHRQRSGIFISYLRWMSIDLFVIFNHWRVNISHSSFIESCLHVDFTVLLFVLLARWHIKPLFFICVRKVSRAILRKAILSLTFSICLMLQCIIIKLNCRWGLKGWTKIEIFERWRFCRDLKRSKQWPLSGNKWRNKASVVWKVLIDSKRNCV